MEGSLEARPGVLLVGAPGVGKRTILSRLLAAEIPDTHDLSCDVLCQGWTIQSITQLISPSGLLILVKSFLLVPSLILDRLAALGMVFDMSDESSLLTLQSWAVNVDMQRFEVLLCIGNKADLVPGHGAHVEYRRRMQRLGESTSDPHPEYSDFGINKSEGCGLLSEEEPCIEIRNSTSQWCIEQNIEYIEACASNTDFDRFVGVNMLINIYSKLAGLSVDGDSQGLERLLGALSAHMWPRMILKSGNKITAPSLIEKIRMAWHAKQVPLWKSTDDESNYDFEYEVLSHGSDDQWEFVGETSTSRSFEISNKANGAQDHAHQVVNPIADSDSSSSNALPSDTPTETAEANNLSEDEHYGLDDLERLMSEIGNMRSNLRLMPDFQREMAANLAMKMAAMFGDDDEEAFEHI
nr:unnamed protein product [Digitaria exilis]